MKASVASTGSALLDEVAATIGVPAALQLSRIFGGRSIYVPKSMNRRHEIAVALGNDTAEKLTQFYGGTEFTIPARPGKRAEVIELAKQPGMTRDKIAQLTGVSERQVYRILGDADDRQCDLFGDNE